MTATETTARELVIEMAGVTCGSMRDPDATVVHDVNWTVAKGDFWAVTGLQGAGKSDFLMMAGGLLPPTHGMIRFFGDELPDFEEGRMEQRLKVGFAFDNGNLFHNLTVAENITLPMRYHREFRSADILERTNRLLEMAELASVANNFPSGLGRNWQKRVGLVRALALQPELLLVDNPLSGADPRHVEWWLKILPALSQGHDWMPDSRPVTLVVTADNESLWRGVAKQFATLRDGRLEIEGANR